LLAALLGAGCLGEPPRPSLKAMLHHPPADEVVIRTDRFAFHMGAKVDPTWLPDAERTRAVLGAALATLLEDEDTAVPVLARQLGVAWPDEPLAFEVALRDERDPRSPAKSLGPCDPARASGLPRRLEVASAGEAPGRFFACVLARSFARLEGEGELGKALAPLSRDGGAEPSHAYGCVVAVAIGALGVAGADGAKAARAIEADAHLEAACSPKELAWVSREWIKRVRDEESAAAFGARLARELAVVPAAP
jgi:hypothetical protein